MFTIDLLKGKGLPLKSRPIFTAFAAIPLVIPLMTAAAMAVCCFQNQAVIQTRKNIILDNQQKTSVFAEDLTSYTAANRQIAGYQAQLDQVNKALGYRIQITPILLELTAALPESLIITKFDLARTDQQKKEINAQTGNAQSSVSVQRKLKLTVGGVCNSTTDQSAEQYAQSLRNSKLMSDCLSSVQIISRSNGTLDDRNCALYEIECNLKEQK